jgi:hypothetical protein
VVTSGGGRGRRGPVCYNARATLEELARAVAPPYVTGILRLTLLAPNIVKAILDGR